MTQGSMQLLHTVRELWELAAVRSHGARSYLSICTC